MNKEGEPKKLTIQNMVIVALIVVCCLEIVVFVKNARDSFTPGQLHQYHRVHLVPRTNFVTADTIEPWMTFDYINFAFGLPPAYLSQTLAIQHPRYPNIVIQRYAAINHINQAVFLQEVKVAVKQYSSKK